MTKEQYVRISRYNLFRSIKKFSETQSQLTPEMVWGHVSSCKSLKDFVTSQARDKDGILDFIWFRTNNALDKKEWNVENNGTRLATRNKRQDKPEGPPSNFPLSPADDEEDNLFKLFGVD